MEQSFESTTKVSDSVLEAWIFPAIEGLNILVKTVDEMVESMKDRFEEE